MSDQLVDAADTTLVPTPDAPPVDSTTGKQPEIEAQLRVAQQDLETANARVKSLEADTDIWKSRFTGSQGTYQRDQEKWKATKLKNEELSTTIASLTEANETATEELATATEELSIVKAESMAATAGLDRNNIIFKEFPSLGVFEADGLLPEGVGDDLRTKLKAFQEKLEKLGVDKMTTVLEGSSPSPPDGVEDVETSEALWETAMKALREGNTEVYEEAYSKYLSQKFSKDKET